MFDQNIHPPGLTRRGLLKALTATCAGLLAPNALSGIFSAPAEGAGGKTFSDTQLAVLRHMANVILPASDTPGAGDAGCHYYIDDQLARCREPEEARKFNRQFDRVENLIQKHWHKNYAELSAKRQEEIMRALSTGQAPFTPGDVEFFANLRSLVILGYYTSEVGGSKELVYLPVPGGYDGDFKLSANNNRAFSPFVY